MEQVLPFLEAGPFPKSPKWNGVQSYRAVGGGMHIGGGREREKNGVLSPKEAPTILIAVISKSLPSGAVPRENKKPTSDRSAYLDKLTDQDGA